MELMEGLLTRRSVRQYQDKKIPKSVMEEIIKAAQYSPTAHNRQPWEFLVVDDKEILMPLAWFLSAAILIVRLTATRKMRNGALLTLTARLLPKI